MKNLMKKYGKNWVCWLIWIGIWQLADLFIHNNIIFAGPFDMALTLAGLLKDGDFWLSLFHSSLRICLGFLSAFCLGILLGSLGWAFPLVKEFLKPPMLMIRSVPVASFVILALIWIGSENLSVFISFLVVVPNQGFQEGSQGKKHLKIPGRCEGKSETGSARNPRLLTVLPASVPCQKARQK
jgi:ABC-type nitrate/sulfonate/bicarbonate transport system permease component